VPTSTSTTGTTSIWPRTIPRAFSKIHLCDSGLAAALSELRPELWNEERKRFGHLLESFVVQQLMAMGTWHDGDPRFSGIWGVEVKAAASMRSKDSKGLRRLAETVKTKFRGGLVLYDGDAVLPIDKDLNIHAAPLAKLWEL